MREVIKMDQKYNIKGREYNFSKDIRENEQLRLSFDQLAKNTFGIDFETWYQNGYWGSNYIPYVLYNEDKVVSNVSVNIINTRWNGIVRHYIQLGTIMTDEKYQGLGLSRFLMEKVLDEYKDKSNSIYLFANDSVLDFYPKFGFVKAPEYQCHKSIAKKDGLVRKLDMSSINDRRILQDAYNLSNPYSKLPMENNFGLIMFYCSKYLKENVYYIEQYKAAAIVEYDDDKMICYDIFCDGKCSLDDILCTLADKSTKTAILGFTPNKTDGFKLNELHEEDTTLFLLKDKENLFEANKLMFPVISHA